jgi:MFS family permease
VRALAITAGAGTVLFVFAPTTPLAFVGTLLWGLGISLGFPVGMSAAADQPELAAGRVSVIASIGYCAFLAAPPAIGFLGEQVTVLRALTAVAVLLALGALLSGAVAPPQARNGEGPP